MEVSIVRRRRGFPVDGRACRRLLRWLGGRMDCTDAACSLLLCGDPEIADLNRTFRHRDTPTDVLAFPDGDPPSRTGYLGDIAISLDTAARQTGRRPLQEEVNRLLLHGFLHLLGFDHETDDGEMRQRERSLWRAWRTEPPRSGRRAS